MHEKQIYGKMQYRIVGWQSSNEGKFLDRRPYLQTHY